MATGARILMFALKRCTDVESPFSCARSMHGVSALGRLASEGLVFGVDPTLTESGRALPVAFTNVSARTWPTHERPWGHTGDSALEVAADVISLLRPDWAECFWTQNFFESVCVAFAQQFLASAPLEGGRVSLPSIRNWMHEQRIGRPVWEFN